MYMNGEEELVGSQGGGCCARRRASGRRLPVCLEEEPARAIHKGDRGKKGEDPEPRGDHGKDGEAGPG